jgi:trimeric autotransporter adhesin
VSSRANGANATATGADSNANGAAATGANAIAIGNGSVATGSIAVGNLASAANGGAAFGDNSVATGSLASAIGPGAQATFANSTALGAGAVTNRANQVMIGTANATYTAPGITSAASLAAQSGSTYFVTSDLNGNLAVSSMSPANIVNSITSLEGNVATLQTQVASLQGQITHNLTEARRGIAAAVATPSAPMPFAPGRTTWQMRGSSFLNEYGFGFAFAHRLNTGIPLSIVGGYGNGGGSEHTGYVGLGGEF